VIALSFLMPERSIVALSLALALPVRFCFPLACIPEALEMGVLAVG
jgi:hypothetical protein